MAVKLSERLKQIARDKGMSKPNEADRRKQLQAQKVELHKKGKL